MIENYVTLSLETHLFFSRIMKEHALFLEAGFPCKDNEWIQEADHYRKQFETLLKDVVQISDCKVNRPILDSGELVTEFTVSAENCTQQLTGVFINSNITKMEAALRPGDSREVQREFMQRIHRINENALCLLDGFIDFKERLLREVNGCRLFTANYPLLIAHILREAKLYRSTIEQLMQNRRVSYQDLWGTEAFWNQIMMEHALFIRGLLDPCEEDLIKTANDFAMDYKRLLETSKQRDCMATEAMTAAALTETLKYRDFKAAGTKGILSCDISSIILPLLADHVLREANHYIRILQCAHSQKKL